ncbi:MAG: polysaccharide deacetylase family protein [Pseudomonadota bacterium]
MAFIRCDFRLLLAALGLGLAGCTSAPTDPGNSRPQVIADRDGLVLMRLASGHTYADAIRASNGYASREEVERLNGARQAGTQIVAVPKLALNPTGFQQNGYRTIGILCYHQFTQADAVSQRLEVTAKAFRTQLQYLRDNQFNVLSMTQVEEILQGKRELPPKAIVLTIDDGYASVYDVALPIVREFGFPVTLYVYTDFVGGGAALSWSQIKELQATGLFDIQSHSKSHSSLSRLEQDKSEVDYHQRVLDELVQSKRALERRLGNDTWQISYPYGNTSDALPQLMQETGYRLGFTVTRGDNTVYTDPAFLYRTMIYGDHNLEDFKQITRTFRQKKW